MKDEVIVRDDKEKKTNHIWHWEAGDKAATDEVFAEREDGRAPEDAHPPHPRLLDRDLRDGRELRHVDGEDADLHDDAGAARDPHRVRAGERAAGGEDPGHLAGHRRRVRRQGARVSGLRGVRRRQPRDRQAGEVDRGPLGEPPGGQLRARLPHRRGDGGRREREDRRAAREDAVGLRRGGRGGEPVEVPGRTLQHLHRLLRHEGRPRRVDGVYTTKPPGGVAYRCSFRVTEAVHMVERLVDIMAHELGEDPAEYRRRNFIRPDEFPYKSPDRLGVRLRELRGRARQGDGDDRLRRACGRSRPRSASAAS